MSVNAADDHVLASSVPPMAPPVIVGWADCTANVLDREILESTEPTTLSVTWLLATEHLT